jgi:hypothetical protein
MARGAMALVVVALAGCAGATARPARWLRTELVFGLARPRGGEVTAAEWQRFVDEEIAPRFPSGFSMLEAAGAWRNAAGTTVREPARVLLILHPINRASDAAIDELRRRYRERFGQESVLRADVPCEISFQEK